MEGCSTPFYDTTAKSVVMSSGLRPLSAGARTVSELKVEALLGSARGSASPAPNGQKKSSRFFSPAAKEHADPQLKRRIDARKLTKPVLADRTAIFAANQWGRPSERSRVGVAGVTAARHHMRPQRARSFRLQHPGTAPRRGTARQQAIVDELHEETNEHPVAPTQKLRALRVDTLRPLIDLAYSNHTEVQCDAAAVMALLSSNRENRCALVAAGSLRPLLALCNSHDRAIRRDAISAISNLTRPAAGSLDEEARQRIVDFGGLRLLLDAVDCHDETVVARAAECLCNFAASQLFKELLFELGVLGKIATLLSMRDSGTRKHGLIAMHRLITPPKRDSLTDSRTAEHIREVFDHGHFLPLLMLLRKNDEEMRHAALEVLCTVAEAGSDWVREKLTMGPVLKTVVAMLCDVPAQPKAAEKAAIVSPEYKLIDNKPLARSAGEARRLATRRQAFHFIDALARQLTLRARLLETGVLPPTLQLLNMSGIDMKQMAASLLHKFAAAPACRQLLLDGGAVRALTALSRSSHMRVVRPAVHAFEELTEDTGTAAELIELQACPTLIGLCVSVDDEVQEYAVDALANMCNPKCARGSRLIELGAIGVLTKLALVPDAALQVKVLRGLVGFATESAAVACEALRHGVVMALIPMLLSREEKAPPRACASSRSSAPISAMPRFSLRPSTPRCALRTPLCPFPSLCSHPFVSGS